jgi:molecular chaperone GrpE
MNHDAQKPSGKESNSDQSPTAGANGSVVESAEDLTEAVASHEQATDHASGEEVEKLSQELAEMKDRLLRTVAEMDNMRKRLEREKADFIKFSTESILKDMIPILDSFDKAVPTQSQQSEAQQAGAQSIETKDISSFHDGMVMVYKQLLAALAKHGLEPVEAVGKNFDPNFHQAIQRIESGDVTQEIVATEFMKGYALNGRLVRPAMVSVKVPEGSN